MASSSSSVIAYTSENLRALVKKAHQEKDHAKVLQVITDFAKQGGKLPFFTREEKRYILQGCVQHKVIIEDGSWFIPIIKQLLWTTDSISSLSPDFFKWTKEFLPTLLKQLKSPTCCINLLVNVDLNLTDIVNLALDEVIENMFIDMLSRSIYSTGQSERSHQQLINLVIEGVVLKDPVAFTKKIKPGDKELTSYFLRTFSNHLTKYHEMNSGNSSALLYLYLEHLPELIPNSAQVIFCLIKENDNKKFTKRYLLNNLGRLLELYLVGNMSSVAKLDKEKATDWLKQRLIKDRKAADELIPLEQLIKFCYQINDFDLLLKIINIRGLTSDSQIESVVNLLLKSQYYRFHQTMLKTPLFVRVMQARDLFNLSLRGRNIAVMQQLLRQNPDGVNHLVRQELNCPSTTDRTMKGLLYAYSQASLPGESDFDFLLPVYYNYCYDYWKVHCSQPIVMREVETSNNENSMSAGSIAPIPKQARIDSITINTSAPLAALFSYIGDQLERLEGHKRALTLTESRQKFIPDVQGDSTKVVDENGVTMSEEQQAIARLHTVVRLLKRDRYKGYNPYFKKTAGEFNAIVALCFEYAKRADNIESFIIALVDIRRGHNDDLVDGRPVYASQLPDRCSCGAGAEGRLYQNYVLNQQLYMQQRDDLDDVLFPFNPDLLWDESHSFVRSQLELMTRNFIAAKDHHHLANICLYLQLSITTAGTELDDDDEEDEDTALLKQLSEKVAQAIDYLVETKVDFTSHLNKLLAAIMPKPVVSSAMQVQMQSIFKQQLRGFFGLEMIKSVPAAVKISYQNTLFKQIYPVLYPAYIKMRLLFSQSCH